MCGPSFPQTLQEAIYPFRGPPADTLLLVIMDLICSSVTKMCRLINLLLSLSHIESIDDDDDDDDDDDEVPTN